MLTSCLADPISAMDQDELPRALIERKETKVLELLRSNGANRHLSTRGKIGETPLHVAASWSRGMELLLHLGGEDVSAMIESVDDNGSTALDYALKLNEPDCVRMLLDASAEMNLEIMQNIEKWEQQRENHAIIPILTDCLAQRRRELLHLANESAHRIPNPEKFNMKEGILLQEDAYEVVQTLLASGISVPKRFRNVQPGSVYHSAHMNAEMAESLLSSGFDHTAVDFMGFTPLMTVDLVALTQRHEAAHLLSGAAELVDWFLSHGEDPGALIPTGGLTGGAGCGGQRLAHRVASELGRCLRRPTALFGSRATPRVSEILTSPATDSCSCLCGRGGCSAASVFSREMWGSIMAGGAWHWSQTLDWGTVRMITDALKSRLDGHPGARQFALSFLRVSTFERLGMSHTCCRYVDNCGKYEGAGNGVALAILKGEYKLVEVMDADDVSEIQEEDRYLAKLLETLVQEFDVKYEASGLPLGDFFHSYWRARMDEVEAGNKVSKEELEALRSTGVVLDA